MQSLGLLALISTFLMLNAATDQSLHFKLFESDFTCQLSRNHWFLIAWYFHRCTYVEMTEIALNKSYHSTFSNQLIEGLIRATQLSVKTFIVDKFYDEPNITYTDTFGRNSMRLEPWETFRNSSNVTQIRRNIRQYKRFYYKSQGRNVRHDEPEFAAFVYVDSLSIIEEYLQGPPRHPFYRPRGNFIITLTGKLLIDWRESAANILEKLWRDYRVFNVIIMMICDLNNMIGFYDPFDPNPDPMVDHTLKDNWGAMKWVALEDIDLENGWLLMKGKNFKGYPFKASTFTRYPTMVEKNVLPKTFLDTFYANAVKYSGGVAGFDGLVLGNLAKVYKFQTIIIKSISYGTLLSDDVFSGSLGDVLYRKADASLNGRFIIDYGTTEIEFLHPVFADKFCVIAPAALQIPGWMAIFRCYSKGVWFGIVSTVLVCKIYRGPVQNLAYRSVERFFIGSCLIFNIIIAGTFQGSLVKSFSTTAYEPEIDTLEHLDKSGLSIVTSANTIKNFFGTDDNPVRSSLRKKFIISNISAIEIAAVERSMTTIERFLDFRIIVETKYKDANGKATLHLVKECPRGYHLGYIVRKGFPFNARFKQTLCRFFESGLMFKWYQEIENSLIAQKRVISATDPVFSFNLEDMQTAFYILGIGLTCLTVFTLEKIYPNFKYF